MIIVCGVFTIIEKLNVKNVIIAKQKENSENYEKFLEIIKQKHIKVILVKSGDRVKIDNETYFEIIWPNKNQLSENALNNNSIVAKFIHKNIKLLFTGDIEEVAEKEIIKLYSKKLEADIIKIAHHGSKTSSIQEFIDLVNPKIALIGVGEKNTFGHPNEDVILRLKKRGINILRTDKLRRDNNLL